MFSWSDRLLRPGRAHATSLTVLFSQHLFFRKRVLSGKKSVWKFPQELQAFNNNKVRISILFFSNPLKIKLLLFLFFYSVGCLKTCPLALTTLKILCFSISQFEVTD